MVSWLFATSWGHVVVLVAQAVCELLLENWAHEQLHQKHSCFESFEAFRRLRKAHWRHHTGKMNVNFGVSNLWFDWLWGTYWPPT